LTDSDVENMECGRTDVPSRELIEGAIRRAIERQRARTGPAPTPFTTYLPECKEEFPKLLCLDLNKWIDLGRAHYGVPSGTAFKPALDAVRLAIQRNTLILPVTGANLSEVVGARTEAQRERLARFMVDLSGNRSIVNHVPLRQVELRRAVLFCYLQRRTSSLRPRLLGAGMHLSMIGKSLVVDTGDPDVDEIATDALSDPEVSVAALAETISAESVKAFRRTEDDVASRVQRIREMDAHLPLKERRHLELRNLLSDGATASALNEELTALRVDEGSFRSWLAVGSNLDRFATAVPGLDVSMTLMLQRDLNRDHRTHPNDGRDFSFLSVAIPYASIVITEKSWSHVARSSGLAKRYGTVVESDAKKLPQLLKAAGCL
jgi:hypothetical protein